MDNNNFYQYSGSVVKMQCPVLSYVFSDLDWTQKQKVAAGVNAQFNEIYWWYPSVSGGTEENDKYVAYNYVENLWTIGTMDRTAWLDLATDGYPIGAKPESAGSLTDTNTTTSLYQHEYGYTANGDNIEAYVTSGPIDIEDGEQFSFISRIIPDVQFVTDPRVSETSVDKKVSMQIYGVNYPMSTAGYQTNTVVVQSDTPKSTQMSLRIRARQIVMKAESYTGGLNRKTPIQTLPKPPQEYDPLYFDALIRNIGIHIWNMQVPGEVVGSSLMLLQCPRSGYGLRNGMVWADGDGVLRIVLPDQVFAPSNAIKIKLGTVTVTT
jgi:hypothetical protein